jgi:hypothetical protein
MEVNIDLAFVPKDFFDPNSAGTNFRLEKSFRNVWPAPPLTSQNAEGYSLDPFGLLPVQAGEVNPPSRAF